MTFNAQFVQLAQVHAWDAQTQIQILIALLQDCSPFDIETILSDILEEPPDIAKTILLNLVDENVDKSLATRFLTILLEEMKLSSPVVQQPVPPANQADPQELFNHVTESLSIAMANSPVVKEVQFEIDDHGAIMRVDPVELEQLQTLLDSKSNVPWAEEDGGIVSGWRAILGSRMIVILVCNSPTGPWVDCYSIPGAELPKTELVLSCEPKRTLAETFDVGRQQFVIQGATDDLGGRPDVS